MAGFATGAMIGLLVQLWLIAIRPCCATGGSTMPSTGLAILGGFGIGLVAAALFAILATLHARLRFWGLFPPVLLVAVLTGMVVALIARTLDPLGAIVVLAPLIGYLVGLLFCLGCGRLGCDPKGAAR